jgi:hypothetical protein
LFEEKISEDKIREENLINIINYKNNTEGEGPRDSMKGEEELKIN